MTFSVIKTVDLESIGKELLNEYLEDYSPYHSISKALFSLACLVHCYDNQQTNSAFFHYILLDITLSCKRSKYRKFLSYPIFTATFFLLGFFSTEEVCDNQGVKCSGYIFTPN